MPGFAPSRLKTIAAGQKPVKDDCIRFAPTNAVSQIPVRRHEVAERHGQKHHEPGKPQNGTIDSHFTFSFESARPLFGRLEVDVLELLDAEHVEHEVLVEGLALAVADLAQEVFLEADLGRVHPLALRTTS